MINRSHSNGGGSSTAVMEPLELHDVSGYLTEPGSRPSQPQSVNSLSSRENDSIHSNRAGDDPAESLPSPTTSSEKLQRWNHPRTNLFRTLAAFWGFVVMGMNDAAYGVRSSPTLKRT
jgi:hypothetical protein